MSSISTPNMLQSLAMWLDSSTSPRTKTVALGLQACPRLPPGSTEKWNQPSNSKIAFSTSCRYTRVLPPMTVIAKLLFCITFELAPNHSLSRTKSKFSPVGFVLTGLLIALHPTSKCIASPQQFAISAQSYMRSLRPIKVQPKGFRSILGNRRETWR